VKNILDFTWDDIELVGYEHDDHIKGAVSIWENHLTFLEKTAGSIYPAAFLYFELSFWAKAKNLVYFTINT
jgi:hypothetical protein